MALLEHAPPSEMAFDFRTNRPGPTLAEEFEVWPQDSDNPMELIDGWVLPMSPGNLATGVRIPDLCMALLPLVRERGWLLSLDARHRLPWPLNTVVYPDLAVHCVSDVEYLPGTETVGRVPELVIELLSKETAGRDRRPRGAKYLAYQTSGVRELYYAWPDGREAAGFVLQDGFYTPLEPDAAGYFASPFLERCLRLVPAGLMG